MKTIFYYLSLVIIVCTPVKSRGYFLPSNAIFDKLIENQGVGHYVIQQEILFSNTSENIVVKENWAIENELSMRLIASIEKNGTPIFKIHKVYKDGTEHFYENQKKVSEQIPKEFFYNLFFSRNRDFLVLQLKKFNILPSDYSTVKYDPKEKGESKYASEDFVRFSRQNNSIDYLIGSPPTEAESQNPGVWIEQDNFVIRKIKLPNQVEVEADNFSEYARGFKYPKQMKISWGANTVNIKTISVGARSNFAKSVMQTEKTDVIDISGINNSTLKESILEFYKRFR